MVPKFQVEFLRPSSPSPAQSQAPDLSSFNSSRPVQFELPVFLYFGVAVECNSVDCGGFRANLAPQERSSAEPRKLHFIGKGQINGVGRASYRAAMKKVTRKSRLIVGSGLLEEKKRKSSPMKVRPSQSSPGLIEGEGEEEGEAKGGRQHAPE